jgi:mannose-6-phosphate isomerase class I
MTNSDNVLRLGLTSKTIAIEAALEAVDLSAQPLPIDPEDVNGVVSYAPPGAPFSVEVVRGAPCQSRTGHARIVVCLQGTATVGDAVLAMGEAALFEASEPTVEVAVDGVAFVAHHTSNPTSQQG